MGLDTPAFSQPGSKGTVWRFMWQPQRGVTNVCSAMFENAGKTKHTSGNNNN